MSNNACVMSEQKHLGNEYVYTLKVISKGYKY